ncbi:phytanoyl-CoA dioxygenase family protein [Muricoccus vinaceus]|uniref:Phytanoyl-CoA dioxygenase family protein n=1 Tax=Muricoccus vinaceus TaxID=424704 RepID=A0ABV6IS11_9PROT
MIGYAQLRPGHGFSWRSAVPYYLQRLVTPRGLRGTVSRGLAAAIRMRHGAGPGGPAGACVAAALAGLDAEGLATTEDLLPADAIRSMLDFFRRQRLIGPGGQPMALEDLPPGTGMAAYPLHTVVACPGLMEAINAPDVLRIAAGYLGCVPTISSLGVRWSFPSSGQAVGSLSARPDQTQLLHRDPDDWRFLKLFVYLTDVGPEDGPHVYVLGSHKTAADLRARPFELGAAERAYGAGSIRTVTGRAGTTFLADTHGIHMGTPPRAMPRLILQVQYSLLPVFAFRYAPVAAALPAHLDAYTNRLMVARPAEAGPDGVPAGARGAD